MGLFGPSNPVFDMLKQDHAKVKKLFEEFEKAKESRTKERIIRDTLSNLLCTPSWKKRSFIRRFAKRSMRTKSWTKP